MSRLSFDPLSTPVPREPATAPAGPPSAERTGPGSFGEHLERAQSAAGAESDRGAADARGEPPADRPGDSSRPAESGKPADRPAEKAGEPRTEAEQPHPREDPSGGPAKTDSTAGEQRGRGDDNRGEEEDAAALVVPLKAEPASGPAGELILTARPALAKPAAGREGHAKKEEPAAPQTLNPKQLHQRMLPSGPPAQTQGESSPETGPPADPSAEVVGEPRQPVAEKTTKSPVEKVDKSAKKAAQQAAIRQPVETADAAKAATESTQPKAETALPQAGLPQPNRATTREELAEPPSAVGRRVPLRQAARLASAAHAVEHQAAAALQQPEAEPAAQQQAGGEAPKPALELAVRASQAKAETADGAPKPTPSPAGQVEPSPAPRAPAAQQPQPSPAAEQPAAPAAEQVDRVRFVQRVAGAFEAAGDRGGSIRLRLHPPELGSLRLELTVRNGMMRARLEAETPAARNLLLDNLPALRERLAGQQIKVEQFDVDLADHGARGSGQQASGQPQPQTPWAGRAPNQPAPRPTAVESLPAPRAAPRDGEGSGFDVII